MSAWTSLSHLKGLSCSQRHSSLTGSPGAGPENTGIFIHRFDLPSPPCVIPVSAENKHVSKARVGKDVFKKHFKRDSWLGE